MNHFDHFHAILSAVAVILFLALAQSMVHDEPRQLTLVDTAYCDPDDEYTTSVIRKDSEGTRSCIKHTRLSDKDQRKAVDNVWPWISSEWNSSR